MKTDTRITYNQLQDRISRNKKNSLLVLVLAIVNLGALIASEWFNLLPIVIGLACSQVILAVYLSILFSERQKLNLKQPTWGAFGQQIRNSFFLNGIVGFVWVYIGWNKDYDHIASAIYYATIGLIFIILSFWNIKGPYIMVQATKIINGSKVIDLERLDWLLIEQGSIELKSGKQRMSIDLGRLTEVETQILKQMLTPWIKEKTEAYA